MLHGASSMVIMLATRVVTHAATALSVAATLALVAGSIGGSGVGIVAAIKIWSYPVELIDKPPSLMNIKSNLYVTVDHSLPEIIRKRMAAEDIMTEVSSTC